MVNKIPKYFTYSKDTENLFLFYQRTSELLFDFSPDSYKVSLHNTRSIAIEAYNILCFIKSDNSATRFYTQYIPDILDELLHLLRNDPAAKELLGDRYTAYISLFEENKKAQGTDGDIRLFESNIRNFLDLFAKQRYYKVICKQLTNLICSKKKQDELIHLSNIFIRELITLGYSKQHIINVIFSYFNNNQIDSAEEGISDLLKCFTFKKKSWDIITYANTKLYGYYKEELYKIIKPDGIELSDVNDAELNELIHQHTEYGCLRKTLVHLNATEYKISLIRASVTGVDPYSAYIKLEKFLDSLNFIVSIFDNEKKLTYRSRIPCLNYDYKNWIAVRRPMEKRLSTKKTHVNYAEKTVSVLSGLHMSESMFRAFLHTASFHGHALNGSMDEKYILVVLWTALESLFVDNSNNAHKSDLVIKSLLEIIQRTYITKTFKYLQYDILRHLRENKPELIGKYSLDDIKVFIKVMFSPSSDEAVRDICGTLQNNPLLRSRIFSIVERDYKDNKHILECLTKHRNRIIWQINRIYRTRNLIVHTGRDVPYVDDLVENLHNYVDFVLNFLICKSWTGERVADMHSLISGIKLDNDLHQRELSTNVNIATITQVYKSLFGPSINVLEYYSKSDI